MSVLCVAGDRCTGYDRREKLAAPVTAGEDLCTGCLASGGRAADQLVRDYRDLEQLLPPSLGQWSDGQPGAGEGAPIPLRLGPEALQRAIWWTTTAWAEVLIDRFLLTPMPTQVRPGYAVAWACRILKPRIGLLAELGPVEMWSYGDTEGASLVMGAEGVVDLAHLHRRALGMLGLGVDVRRLPGYCQARGCGKPDLRQDNGSDTVYCGWCGHRITRGDYERYGNVFLRGEAA